MNIETRIADLGKGKSKDRVNAYTTLLKEHAHDPNVINAISKQLIKEPNSNTFHLVAMIELGQNVFESYDIEIGETKLPWLSILQQRVIKCRNKDSRNKAISWLVAFHRRTKKNRIEVIKTLKDISVSDKEIEVRFYALNNFIILNRGSEDPSIFKFLIQRYEECSDPREKTSFYGKIGSLGYTPLIEEFLIQEIQSLPFREPEALSSIICSHSQYCGFLIAQFFEIFKKIYSSVDTLSKQDSDVVKLSLFKFLTTLINSISDSEKAKLITVDFLLFFSDLSREKIEQVGDKISVVATSKLLRKITEVCRYRFPNDIASREVMIRLIKKVDDGSPLLPENDRFFMIGNLVEFNKKNNINLEHTLNSLEPWWKDQSKALKSRVNSGVFYFELKTIKTKKAPPSSNTSEELNLYNEIAGLLLNYISSTVLEKDRKRILTLWEKAIEKTKITNNLDLVYTIFYSTLENNDIPFLSFIQDLRDYSNLPEYFDFLRESLSLDLNQNIYDNDEELSLHVDQQLSIFASYLKRNGFYLINIDNGGDEHTITTIPHKSLSGFKNFMSKKLNTINFTIVT